MVKSQIFPDKINYNENKDTDKEDIGHASTVYETHHFTEPIEIALGKEKHTYSSHGITYFPVYLIINNIKKDRIGIVEIESNRFIDSLDEDGDFMIENGNLIFFVDDKYISEMMKDQEQNKEDEEDEEENETLNIGDDITIDVEEIDKKDDTIKLDDIEELDDDVLNVDIPDDKRSSVAEKTEKELEDGIFELMDPMPSVETLIEENREMSQQQKQEYKVSSNDLWIEKFMKNTNY
jgi:hypothetical protein